MDPLIAKAVQDDGSLDDGLNFLAWHPGDEKATLDGEFTAAQLRDIADHMDRLNGRATAKEVGRA